jgi:hypothetical protein
MGEWARRRMGARGSHQITAKQWSRIDSAALSGRIRFRSNPGLKPRANLFFHFVASAVSPIRRFAVSSFSPCDLLQLSDTRSHSFSPFAGSYE